VYGYGFMLSVTFIVASILLSKELERKQMDPELVGPATILAVVFGWLGSKIFDVFEYWDRFVKNPMKYMLSGSGLTFLGGFLFATAAILTYLRFKKVNLLRFCDATTPGLMIGYGIARIGCQLSGDGDYGIPTTLPWGMSYPNGTVPTTQIVHPTPVYETLISFILFGILWKLRKRPAPNGWLFFLYLVLSGTERFLIEFIRLNPSWLFGLSQSQLTSGSLIIVGIVGLVMQRNEAPAARQAAG
jgi:phosphatidylglycerol:prolipoprotein diacylglycerol transferase